MSNSSEPSTQNSLPANANTTSVSGGLKTLFDGAPTTSNSITPSDSSPSNHNPTNIFTSAKSSNLNPLPPENNQQSFNNSASFNSTSSSSPITDSSTVDSASKPDHVATPNQVFVPATAVPEISSVLSDTKVSFHSADTKFEATPPSASAPQTSSQPDATSSQSNNPNSSNSFFQLLLKNPVEAFKTLQTKQIIFLAIIVVIFIALIILIISLFTFTPEEEPIATPPPTPKKTIIEYWGLWEDAAIIQKVLTDFEKETGISVKYTEKDINGYRAEVQSILSGETTNPAPDVFRYHFSWVPMLVDYLAPAPENYFSQTYYSQTFYPVATNFLTTDNGIVGVPLEYDGLALVYNPTLFELGGVSAPPADWASFGIIARQLTQTDPATGRITQAGAAIGLADNVDHFSDLLGAIAIQNGVDFTQSAESIDDDAGLVSALDFYASFYLDPTTRVWDEHMSDSIIAFAENRVAMIFVPSYRIHDIYALNPDVDLAVAPLPTIDSSSVGSQTWATFWVEGVSVTSEYQDEAWELLNYLTQPEVEKAFFDEAVALGRTFGEIYSRVDLATSLSQNIYAQPYLYDAPRSSNFYFNDNTFDDGINDESIDYLAEIINQITAQGTNNPTPLDSVTAAQRLRTGLQEVLLKYGVISEAGENATANSATI